MKKEIDLIDVDTYYTLYHKEPKVEDKVTFFAGAPGVGRVVYSITRISNGMIYGKLIEDTMWVPEDPAYFA